MHAQQKLLILRDPIMVSTARHIQVASKHQGPQCSNPLN